MYKFPYIALAAKLRTETALKSVQFNRNQEAQEGELTTQPMVLIRFLPGNTESLGNGIQQIRDQQVEFSIITNSTAVDDKVIDTVAGHPDHDMAIDYINQVLSYTDIRLSDIPGYEDLTVDEDFMLMGTLDRTSIVPLVKQPNGRMKSTIVYKGSLYDYSAMPVFQTVTKDLVVEELGWI